MGLIDWLVG